MAEHFVSPRSRSPVPGLSVSNLLTGCKCAIASTSAAFATKAQQTSIARSIAPTRPSSSIARPITSGASARVASAPKTKDALISPKPSSLKAVTAARLASAVSSATSTTRTPVLSILVALSPGTISLMRGPTIASTGASSGSTLKRPISSSEITSPQAASFGTSSHGGTATTKKTDSSITAIRGELSKNDVFFVYPSMTSLEGLATESGPSLQGSTPGIDTMPLGLAPDVRTHDMTSQLRSTSYKSITVIRGQPITTKAKLLGTTSIQFVNSETSIAIQTRTSLRWASNRGKLPMVVLQTHSSESGSANSRSSSRLSDAQATIESGPLSQSVGFNTGYSRSDLSLPTFSSADHETSSISATSHSSIQLTSSTTAPRTVARSIIPSDLVSSELGTTLTSRPYPASGPTMTLDETAQVRGTIDVFGNGSQIELPALATSNDPSDITLPTLTPNSVTKSLSLLKNIGSSFMPTSTTSMPQASVSSCVQSCTSILRSIEPSSYHSGAEYPTYSSGGGYPQWVPTTTSGTLADQLPSSTMVPPSLHIGTSSDSSSRDADSPQISMMIATIATDRDLPRSSASTSSMGTSSASNPASLHWTGLDSSGSAMPLTPSEDVVMTAEVDKSLFILPTQAADTRRTMIMSRSSTKNLDEFFGTPSPSASSRDVSASRTNKVENDTSTSPALSTRSGIGNGSAAPVTPTMWRLTIISSNSIASKSSGVVRPANMTAWTTAHYHNQSVAVARTNIDFDSSRIVFPQDTSTKDIRSSTWSAGNSFNSQYGTTRGSQNASPTDSSVIVESKDISTLASSNDTSVSAIPTSRNFANVTRYKQDHWSTTTDGLANTTATLASMISGLPHSAIMASSSSSKEFFDNSTVSAITDQEDESSTRATNKPSASLTLTISQTESLGTKATPDFLPTAHLNGTEALTLTDSAWFNSSSYDKSLTSATAVNTSEISTMSSARISRSNTKSSSTSPAHGIPSSTMTESNLPSASSDSSPGAPLLLTSHETTSLLASAASDYNAGTLITTASFDASITSTGESVTPGSLTDLTSSDPSAVFPPETPSSSYDDVSVPIVTEVPGTDSSVSYSPDQKPASDSWPMYSSSEESRSYVSEPSAPNGASSFLDSTPEITNVLSSSPTASKAASESITDTAVYSSITYSQIRTAERFADTSTEEAGPSSSMLASSSSSPMNRTSLQVSLSTTPKSTGSSHVSSKSESTPVETETGTVTDTTDRPSHVSPSSTNTALASPETTYSPVMSTESNLVTCSSDGRSLSLATLTTISDTFRYTESARNSSSSKRTTSNSPDYSCVDDFRNSTYNSTSTYYTTTTSPESLDHSSSFSVSMTGSAYSSSASTTTSVREWSASVSSSSIGVCQTGAASDLSSYSSASWFCSTFMAPAPVSSTTTVYSTRTTATTSFTTHTQIVQTETSQRTVTKYHSASTVTTTTCVPASNSGNNFHKRDATPTSTAYTTLQQTSDDVEVSRSVLATCSAALSVLSEYSCEDISSACSCHGVTSISQTPTSTVTVVNSIEQTDSVVWTTTESVTVTVLSSSTSYIPQTSTVLYCPRPSTDCGNKGYSFAYYGNEPYGNDVGNMDATYTKKLTPNYNSTTNLGIGIYGSEWASVSLYGSAQTYSDNYFYLSHRGYFYAQVTGNYNFTIKDADDVAYVWMGENAYTGWTGSPSGGNYVAKARCCWSPENTNTTTYYMEAQTYVPFRIVLGQQDGSTSLGLTITAPDGTVILETGKESDYVVQYSCDGTAPPFPDWGYET
jgi:hypothetical protein